MAFGNFNSDQQRTPMADINVTPMVDVMLVLLVIFILTAPLFTHSIKLDLPKVAASQTEEKPGIISLSINQDGQIFWDDKALSLPEVELKLSEVAKRTTPPEIQLRADKKTRYEVIAQVMGAAQTSGLTKLGFVTDSMTTPNKE